MRRIGGLAAMSFATGCYTFAPVAPSTVADGARVRIGLTGQGAVALAPALGTGISGVEGAVLRRNGDTLLVRPTTLDAAGGVDFAWTGGDVAIPTSYTSGVQLRRLSKGRTALFAGVGVAAAVGAIAIARGGGGQGGPSGGDGPPNLSRNPR